MPHAAAVDIGGTSWSVAVRASQGMRVIASGPTGHTPAGELTALRSAVREACTPGTGAGAEAFSMGIAFPGAVDHRGVVTAWPNRPQWIGRRLRDDLGVPPGTPIAICDDGVAATAGESRLGAGRGLSDLVVLSLGTGIGGGILIDHRVRRPADPDARTIGHLRALGTTRPCRCGRTGCLQTALETLPGEQELRRDGLAAWPEGERLVATVGDLARLLDVPAVMLTGGLMQRPGLREVLVPAFTADGLRVVVPPRPDLSALLGAFLAEDPIQ